MQNKPWWVRLPSTPASWANTWLKCPKKGHFFSHLSSRQDPTRPWAGSTDTIWLDLPSQSEGASGPTDRILPQFRLSTLVEAMSLATPANLTGLPAISLPTGHNARGLPTGFQAMGRARQEPTLPRLPLAAPPAFRSSPPEPDDLFSQRPACSGLCDPTAAEANGLRVCHEEPTGVPSVAKQNRSTPGSWEPETTG